MILWKSKETPETRGDSWPCEAFRWVVEVKPQEVSLNHQHKSKSSHKWHSSHTSAFGVCVTEFPILGIRHIYYDGPHCSFSIGWVHFFWGGDPRTLWCEKCYAGDHCRDIRERLSDWWHGTTEIDLEGM